MNVEERLRRERDFHDARVSEDDPRAATAVFNRIVKRSHEDYWERISDDCAGKRILEYGCGLGSAAFGLGRAGAEVFGIDISPRTIEVAKARADSDGLTTLEFAVMDAERLDFPDCSFDRVVGTGILHHLDLVRSLSEIARVLRPGGRAIFIEPLGHNPFINWYRNRTPDLRTADEHPLKMDDLRLAKRWFGRVTTSYYYLATLGAIPLAKTKAFDGAHQVLKAFDRVLLTDWSPVRKYAWMTLIEMAEPKGT